MIDKTLPSGTYIIDKACGRGKTTEIFDFIFLHYNEGVLYCVDSLAELHKMYERLYLNLVLSGKIAPEDIMILTSEQTIDAQNNLYDYHTSPNILCNKKILLITHIRFFTSLVNYFLIYKPIQPISIFNGNFNDLLTRNDLRKWIFFDETPIWIRPFCILPYCLLGDFSIKHNNDWICKTPAEIHDSYNRFIKNTHQDPFGHQTHLDQVEMESVLSMVPTMHYTWISQSPTQDIEIYFRPRDLAVKHIQTHVLFFEGAANLLLQNSPFTVVPTHGKKYNAYVYFHSIPLTTTRGKEFNRNHYQFSLKSVIDIVLHNRTNKKKTLLCVWKTEDSSKTDMDLANSSQFRDSVKDYLIHSFKQIGIDCDSYFDVIYYGENKCKSCNDYFDYSAIILFGKWFLPNSKCIEINKNWGTNTQPLHFHMWFYVQLISRIGIRRHNGDAYDVYMTNDFSSNFVKCLDDYFNKDIVPTIRKVGIQEDLEDWLSKVRIHKRLRIYIKQLCKHIPELREYILNFDSTTPYVLEVSDEELKMIIPSSNGNFSRSKNRLIDALRRFNVALNISSENTL